MEAYHIEGDSIQEEKTRLYPILCTEVSYRLPDCCASRHCDTSSPPVRAFRQRPLSRGPGENRSIPRQPVARKPIMRPIKIDLGSHCYCILISLHLLAGLIAYSVYWGYFGTRRHQRHPPAILLPSFLLPLSHKVPFIKHSHFPAMCMKRSCDGNMGSLAVVVTMQAVKRHSTAPPELDARRRM